MIYLYILFVFVTFYTQAMEQLSPRSRQIVTNVQQFFQEQCIAQQIDKNKQKTILTAFNAAFDLGVSKSISERKYTVDDWDNFDIEKLSNDQLPKGEKIIATSEMSVIRHSAPAIIKSDIKTRKTKIIYEQEKRSGQVLGSVDYISDQSFSFRSLRGSNSCIYVSKNNVLIPVSVFSDRLLQYAPMSLNADGSVLTYISERPLFGENKLEFFYVNANKHATLAIDFLKAACIERQPRWASLTRNPANANEMICLSVTGKLYRIDINFGQPAIVQQFKAFTGRGEQKVIMSPNGKFLVATNDKMLKIWDREFNFNKPETYGMSSTIKALSFSPGSNYLAVVIDNCIQFLSLKNWAFIATEIKGQDCENFIFMPDGVTAVAQCGTICHTLTLQQLPLD